MVDATTNAAIDPAAIASAEAKAQQLYNAAAKKSFGASGELTGALDAIDPTSDYSYDPAVQQYLANAANYLSTQNTGYNLTPDYAPSTTPSTAAEASLLTNGSLASLASQPVANTFQANFNPSATGSAYDMGNLAFNPNQQYQLVDNSTGKVVYSGTGYDAGSNISSLINNMFSTQGTGANLSVQSPTGANGAWQNVYSHASENDNTLGQLGDIVLPAVGALLAPVTGGLSAALAAGLGAAGGSALSGTLQGKSIGDIATQAALAGGTTFAGGSLLGSLGSTDASTAADAVDAGGISTGGLNAISAPLDIATPTASDIAAALGPTTSASAADVANAFAQAGGVAASAAPTVASVAPDTIGSTITVAGAPASTGALASLASPAISAVAPTLASSPVAQQTAPEVQTPTVATPEQDITVVGTPTPTGALASLASAAGAAVANPLLAAATAPAVQVASQADATQANQDAKNTAAATPTAPSSTLSTIANTLKAGAAISSLVGAATGGGGSSASSSAMPAGILADMALPASFTSALPTAQSMYTGTNYGTGAGTAGGASTTPGNWIVPYTTAIQQAPTMSDMPTVQSVQEALARAATGGIAATNPMAVIPQAPVSKAHGGPIGYAEGGSDDRAFAVRGPGTGRSDSIPANLSDGEYVVDAETVALLGDGSSKAGADKLDQMRVNIRKQKGRNLAQGKFSVNAKQPEAYLSGGRI